MSVGSSRWHSRLQILRRRGRLVFWSGLATLAIAEAFVLGLPSLYRSSATLLVQGGVSDAFVQSSVPDAINARLQTIKQEALSRGRLEELIRRFGLYGASPDKNVSEAMLARFQRDVRVDVTNDQSANGKSTAIAFSLSYVGNAPQTAADVANALASFYVAQNNQMRAEQASKATEYIGAQLAETKGRLDAQESKVSGYTAENMGALPQQVDANLAAVTRLDAQLRLNGEERLKLVERRQTLQNQIAEIDTRVPPADDASPAAQVTRKQKELADLRAQFPDTYPDVRMAKAELAQLQRLAANATATPAPGASERATATQALSETNTQIQALEKEDTSLRNEIDTYEKRVDTAPAHQPVIEGLCATTSRRATDMTHSSNATTTPSWPNGPRMAATRKSSACLMPRSHPSRRRARPRPCCSVPASCSRSSSASWRRGRRPNIPTRRFTRWRTCATSRAFPSSPAFLRSRRTAAPPFAGSHGRRSPVPSC